MTAATRAPLDGSPLGRRFTALTGCSPVPTLLARPGLRLALANDAFCALLGRPAEDLRGTGWWAGVHPDDLDHLAGAAAAASGGRDVERQVRLVRADDVVRVAVLRFAAVSTPDAGPGLVGTVEDVTDRLAFQAELARPAGADPQRPAPGVAAGTVPAPRQEEPPA